MPLVALLGTTNMPAFILGTILVIIGESVRLWASGHVKKNKILAPDGPYAFVRHPLYVGNILVLLGFSIASMFVVVFCIDGVFVVVLLSARHRL